MSLDSLIIYSLAILGALGLVVVGFSYLAYALKNPQQSRKNL